MDSSNNNYYLRSRGSPPETGAVRKTVTNTTMGKNKEIQQQSAVTPSDAQGRRVFHNSLPGRPREILSMPTNTTRSVDGLHNSNILRYENDTNHSNFHKKPLIFNFHPGCNKFHKQENN